ncbi:hypothetical protein ACQP1W_00100 [Spirillospora sp. CA-255316]
MWTDDGLHFAASDTSRKSGDIARDPRCAVTTRNDGLDLVVEGTAVRVTDESRLRRAAGVYGTKYGWHVTVRDGAFHDTEGAPTAGPPPYALYGIVPDKVLAFPVDERFAPTRWRF